MAADTQTIRIFISSPGDVNAERDKAKQVITQLQKWYGPAVTLVPVLWEDIPLEIDASFQNGIDVILSGDQGIDIAVFILWSRIGTPVTIGDRTYQSGTEREFDLMLHALEASGGARPDIIYYKRNDDDGFTAKLADPANKDQLQSLIDQRNLAESFVQEQFWDESGQNTRAYHSFRQPVEFAGRFKVHLQGLIDRRLEESGLTRDATWADVPYRGLETFHLQHADIFFGREREIVELETRLRDRAAESTAFVAVIGSSGSGKSSLVRGGLRASLTRFNLDESVSEWRSAVMLPAQAEGDPVAHLVRCLTEPEALPQLANSGVALTELAENIADSPRTAVNLAIKPLLGNTGHRPVPPKTIGEAALPQQSTQHKEQSKQLLVIIDQFEEFFTDTRITAESREIFLHVLEALAQSGVCWVVATLRSDFYPIAQKSETFLRLKGENGHFDLLAPGPEALRRIITEPARMASVRFEKRAPELGGQSVVGKILEDAKDQPDMLPLLSDLLLELYNHRSADNTITFAAYEALGDPANDISGLEGALSQRAEKEFAKLTAEQRATCPEILHALVTVEADADVRRRANLNALRDTPQKAALVDAFISARLLTADGETVSLAHEALLRKWPRIADWVRDNRQHLRVRSRVEQSLRLWQNRDRDPSLLLSEGVSLAEGVALLQDAPHLLAGSEYQPVRDYIQASDDHHRARAKRAKRIRGFVMAGLSALTLVALAGGLFARLKQVEAEEQRAFAEAETERAEKQKIQSDIAAGEGWLLRAQVADEKGNDIAASFYAARAVGFEDFGRTAAVVAKTNPDPLDFSRVRRCPGATKVDHIDVREEFPRLLTFDRAPVAFSEARRVVEYASALPFVWSSPVASHHSDGVTCVAVSPDGKTIASSSKDHTVRLWSVANGTEKILRGHLDSVESVAFSPDGGTIASASMDNSIMLWNFAYENDKPTASLEATIRGHSGWVTSVAFSPDGRFLASGSQDNNVKLWNLETRREIATFGGHSRGVTSVAFSPDGQTLVSSGDRHIHLWELKSGHRLAVFGDHSGPVLSVAFSSDGGTLASSSVGGFVKLWDTKNGSEMATLRGHSDRIGSVVFSPDNQMLASGSNDNSIKLWRLEDASEIASFTGHTDEVRCLAFSRDGRTLISGSEDNSIKLWNVDSERDWSRFSGHSRRVEDLVFSPDGQLMASASWDKTIRLWDLALGVEINRLKGHSGWITSLDFSPDGEILATGSWDKSVKLWDVKSGQEIATLSGHSKEIYDVDFGPFGKTIASASGDGSVLVWDLTEWLEGTNAKIAAELSLLGHSGFVYCVAISADGQTIATASGDGSIKIWDLRLGQEAATLIGHQGPVYSIAFSPDGQTLVSGSYDNSVKLWDLKSQKETHTLRGHLQSVTSVAFSSNGKLLVSGSGDRTIRLWNTEYIERGVDLFDVKTGNISPILPSKTMITLRGHSSAVQVASLSPDGTTLASGSLSGSIKLWDAGHGIQRATLHGHANVENVAFSPDGGTIACGFRDGVIKLMDFDNGNDLMTLVGHSGNIERVIFSPDGQTLASCDGGFRSSSNIKLWDARTGKQKATLTGHSSDVLDVAFSPDGQTLASASSDHSIKIWNLKLGVEVASIRVIRVKTLSFSPGGGFLACGSDASIRLWDVENWQEKAVMRGHKQSVECLAWSPNGQIIASGSFDHSIKFWDATSGKETITLFGHSNEVKSLAFSSDGSTLASCEGKFLLPSSIKLWNVRSGKEITTMRGHEDTVNSVAFRPLLAQLVLVSASNDRTVKVWELMARPDLFAYIDQHWCHFDPESHELVWNEPKRNLYKSIETPFRNVPKHSGLGILQNPDLSEDERNWRLYLKAIEAENWATAAIYHARLTDENKSRPHANVVWAATKVIPDQIDAALENGFVKLAEMRLASAQLIAAKLPEEHRAHFVELERKLGATAP